MRVVVHILIVLAVAILPCEPASAFWNLFGKRQNPRSMQPDAITQLESLRVGGCGNAQARDIFGETEFMRGRRTRLELKPELQKAMAAAFLAETPEDARSILAPYQTIDPYLMIDDVNARAAARIGLAFALLRKAAADRRIRTEVRELVSHADAVGRVDAQYILGTVALYERRWTAVKAAAVKVLKREPQHFNANVLRSLAVLQSIARDRWATRTSRCRATLSRMIDALHPVMALGACPTQMAHLDITAERYLTFRDAASASRQSLLRRLILAYVSRNDAAALATLVDYRSSSGTEIPCEASARALKLIPGVQ